MTVVPVTGDPAGVVDMAHALGDLAARIGAVEGQLVDLRTMATWESPSGWRFDGAIRALPDVLDLLQARYRAAAEALLRWAVDLRVAIRDSTTACETHERARADLDAIERDLQVARLEPASAWHETLRTRQVLAWQQAAQAEESCSRAWLRLHDDAAVCSASLHAAARDSMVDSTAYGVVRTTRSTTAALTAVLGAASLVPSPVQAFTAAATGVGTAVVVGADLLLLLGFGDGSWSEVLTSAFAAAAGKGASGLTRAAGVGAVKTVNGTWTGQRLRSADRLREGRDEIIRELRGQRRALRTPVVPSQPSAAAGAGARPPLHRRTIDLLENRLEAKVLGINDRWQMALANGGNAVVLQGGAEAMRVAQRAHQTHQHAVEAGERVREPARLGDDPRG